jgi:hypothetical protein
MVYPQGPHRFHIQDWIPHNLNKESSHDFHQEQFLLFLTTLIIQLRNVLISRQVLYKARIRHSVQQHSDHIL